MNQTGDHMMQGMHLLMPVMWFATGIFAVLVVATLVHFLRPTRNNRLQVAELPGAPAHIYARPTHDCVQTRVNHNGRTHDTIFVLPDISNYTKFMAGNHFSFAHAQLVIFSLINAMIDAATKTVELSKLEGDAALFYVDADEHSDVIIGETVLDTFRAFFRERRRLAEANLCRCRACRHISELDLKIFVHRGQAARFKFRGSVDHFGTDVIVLHRLLKNSVHGQRYIMVTESAGQCIKLPNGLSSYSVEEDIEHVGPLGAAVFDIDDAMAAQLTEESSMPPPARFADTMHKLRENLRSLQPSVLLGNRKA